MCGQQPAIAVKRAAACSLTREASHRGCFARAPRGASLDFAVFACVRVFLCFILAAPSRRETLPRPGCPQDLAPAPPPPPGRGPLTLALSGESRESYSERDVRGGDPPILR